jgi:hypothetical protein
MRTRARGLAVWTLAMALARVAVAQEPGPPPDEPPPADEPPPVEVVPGPPGQPGQPGPPGAPPPAGAVPAAVPPAGPGLGELAQIAISDDLQVSAVRDSSSLAGRTTTNHTIIMLQPALDYFIAPNVSLGGQVRIAFDSVDTGSGTTADTTVIGLLPRIGYVIAFSPTTVIWPRAGLGYVHMSSGDGVQQATTGYRVPLELFVPIIFQPIPHFFIGGGIRVATDLVSKVEDMNAFKLTEIGLVSTLGGYLGGP